MYPESNHLLYFFKSETVSEILYISNNVIKDNKKEKKLNRDLNRITDKCGIFILNNHLAIKINKHFLYRNKKFY